MLKNTNTVWQKNADKFWSDNRFLKLKILSYFNKVWNSYCSTCYQNWAKTAKLKPNQTRFDGTCSNLTSFFLSKNINDFQNRNFWILINEPKQWISNKIRHFPIGHIQLWRHIFFYKKIISYSNDFQNRNFSVLWPKWTQAMEMKQNQKFFHGTYSNLTSFCIRRKILKYLNDFYDWHLSVSLQNLTKTGKVK